jgi:hypothetical protein
VLNIEVLKYVFKVVLIRLLKVELKLEIVNSDDVVLFKAVIILLCVVL